MRSMARGSAASELVVANAIETGSAIAFRNLRIGTFARSAIGRSTSRRNASEGQVEGGEGLGQVHQDAEAHVADRVGDRRAHPDRGEEHHQVRELEHGRGERLGEGEHRPPPLVGEERERDREEHAEHDDLQDLALGHGLRDVLREGVQDRRR